MKKLILLMLAVACMPMAKAQTFDQYHGLISTGVLPDEVLTLSSQKYESESRQIDRNDASKVNKTELKAFSLESHFLIDRLMQSGKVLYNDPISLYVNKVVQEILQYNPELDQNIRVYTLRSTEVNAFATDRGTIFITLGMIAQLENEAQLAFVLCHELVHVKEKHAMNLFLEARKLDKKKFYYGDLMNQSKEEYKLFSKNRFSKELEMEADEKGIQYFLKTKYSIDKLNTVFDILKYAYLPFDNLPFEYGFLESETYKIPREFMLSDVKSIKGTDEEEDNEKSSHPNIGKRRAALQKAINNQSGTDREHFQVSRDEFLYIQKIARFELPNLYLQYEEFPNALYTSYLLQRRDPENKFLKKGVAQTLYLAAKYRVFDLAYDTDYEEIEGESQAVYFLLDSLQDKELVVMALQYVIRLDRQYPDDLEIQKIKADLFKLFCEKFEDLSDFYDVLPQEQPAAENVAVADSLAVEVSKYDRIKQQISAKKGNDDQYWQFAFSGLLKDAQFKKDYEEGKEALKTYTDKKEYYESAKGKIELRKIDREEVTKGQRLNIDKFVMVDPVFLDIQFGKENSKMRYLETEAGEHSLVNIIQETAATCGANVQVLGVNGLKNTDSGKFNDLRFLTEWFSEQLRMEDMTLTPGMYQEKVDSIAAKYGTEYFVWTGIVAVKSPSLGYLVKSGIFSILYPAATPAFLHQGIRSQGGVLYFAIIFNIKTGERSLIKYSHIKNNYNLTYAKLLLYDTILQISKK